eukprot:TRINITY_DN18453_c0_g1_i1.p1 TRINITY_DN18453_c0_g1~~TRINITY_DN18453_c0_g1_i1.p1  ORF type:complete len:293 (+),score=44.80 TRINITY_DN18453_c0_g1_i1:79-957(+)
MMKPADDEVDEAACQRRSGDDLVNDNVEVSSEASTDIGSDEELEVRSFCTYHATEGARGHDGEEEHADELTKLPPAVATDSGASVEPPSRPRFFAKVTRRQRLEHLAKLLEEYCNLDFDAVDASAQNAVVLRMLALLRSLRHAEVYHDADGNRCSEERYSLLGLAAEGTEMVVLDKLNRQAEALANDRCFRPAFELMCEARPLFRRCCQDVGTACGPLLDDDQAMLLRRWLRKQRQREERRHQRASERGGKPACIEAEAPKVVAPQRTSGHRPAGACHRPRAMKAQGSRQWT